MKKINKKRFVVTILSLLCLACFFCLSFVAKKGKTPETNSQIVTVTDQTGRTVTIKKPVKRIISGYYVSTSALLALGLDDKLVAIEAKQQSGKRAIYGFTAKRISTLPTVGTSKFLDVEKCIALKPDLVILPQRLAGVVQTFDNLGIPVLLVRPESFDECQEMLDIIAKATGTEQRAEKYRTFAKKQREFLASLPKNGKSVYVTGVPSLLVTFGKNLLQSDLVMIAGGRNVASDINDLLWVNISYEQLLAWNPEVIILAADAKFSVQDVLRDKKLANCRAVRAGQVYKMPNKIEAWDTPVPSNILGSLWLASKLYPGKISTEYFEKTVKEFYKEFYGFEFEYEK